tara:strand:+ start:35 stop:229 length:195 start_codon:yes stop_codon:yes gene_type:complete
MENENIIDSNTNDSTTNNVVEINVELLKQLRGLMDVVNGRIHWKTEELIPVGVLVKQLDDLLKN